MDLDIVRVIKSIPKEHEPEPLTQLTTPWGEELLADEDAVPLHVHPRPQFARKRVKLLNGWWEYAIRPNANAAAEWDSASAPDTMDGKIRVPFSPETLLSGVERQLGPRELLWYRTELTPPPFGPNDRCVLHFEGVDHACAAYLGNKRLGTHEGAYQPFSFDVTDELRDGSATLELCVFDPSDTGTQLRGKQRLENGGMWYTAQSGIWQTVWLEVVPAVHMDDLRIFANPDTGEIKLTTWVEGNAKLFVSAFDADGNEVAQAGTEPAAGVGIVTMQLKVEDARLWSPDDPYLYKLRLTYGTDEVQSYCAFRCLSVEKDAQGMPRICLNHKPFFMRGLLDQGYWPDSLLTPPSDEAMEADLRAVRDMGFNMVRKHIKVEPERWYWHADRLGVLVWQDMPSGGDNPQDRYARDMPTLWRRSWHSQRDNDAKGRERLGSTDETYRHDWTNNMAQTISRLYNHPSVVVWVLFNESWGQFDSALATQLAWEMDDTRPVLSCSGWYDQGVGDIRGVHNYFRGIHMFADPYAGGRNKKPTRAQVVSEFGGLNWKIDGHSALLHDYGYAQFETKEAWRAGLADILAKTDAMEAEGLSGFVYTQLTDVEEETNGLITYDRKVRKLD